MVNAKKSFWQALIFTIVVFRIGIILGFFFEVSRTNSVEIASIGSETNLLDQELRTRASEHFNFSCEDSAESLFRFADLIYREARQLERYGQASKFSETIDLLHRRYDLLRTMLWIESIETKKKCGNVFHTVVYLYRYNAEDVDVKAKQVFFSRVLGDVKEANPQDILLIPIAEDTGLESVRAITQKFSIESYPVIIIDEKLLVYEIDDFGEFERLVLNG